MNGYHRILQALMYTLGFAAIFIGSMIIFLGVLDTLYFFEAAYSLITSTPETLEPKSVSATIDNEFRFYAVLWFSYGLYAVNVAYNIIYKVKSVPILLAVFFMGGIARGLSVLAMGNPHPLFILLMALELIIPLFGSIVYFKLLSDTNQAGDS